MAELEISTSQRHRYYFLLHAVNLADVYHASSYVCTNYVIQILIDLI